MSKTSSTRTAARNRPATTQLAFDFEQQLQHQPAPLTVKSVPLTPTEVLPPATPLADDPPDLTQGALEHQFLRGRADKYEERAIRAVYMFVVSCCLTVLVKGGIPLSQVALEKLGLPVVTNARLLAGMLGGADIVFAVIIAYYTLQFRHHSPQLNLRLVNLSLAGRLARLLLWSGIVVLGTMFLTVIYLTWRDILYFLTYLLDHHLYIMEGWDPVQR